MILALQFLIAFLSAASLYLELQSLLCDCVSQFSGISPIPVLGDIFVFAKVAFLSWLWVSPQQSPDTFFLREKMELRLD